MRSERSTKLKFFSLADSSGWRFRRRLRAVQHHHVADAHDQVAGSFLSEGWREFLLLFLEVGEFDLHQFMLSQCGVYRLDEPLAQSGFADLEHGVQQLRGRFEFTDL